MILTCAYRRGYSARALEYVDTTYLMKNDLFAILERYPTLAKQVRRAAIRMAFIWTVKPAIRKMLKKGKHDDTEVNRGGWEDGDNKGAIKDEQEILYRKRFAKNQGLAGPSEMGGGGGGGMGIGIGMSEEVESMLREQKLVMDTLRRDIGFLKRTVEEIQRTQEAEANSSFSKLLSATL